MVGLAFCILPGLKTIINCSSLNSNIMNSMQEQDYWWCTGPWTRARAEAVRDGYQQLYVKHADGRYRTLSEPDKFYRPEELNIYRKKCGGKTLVLIEHKNGDIKGILF
jgi:hypothetical protein